MLRVLPTVVLTISVMTAGPAYADRLVGQAVDGTKRICIYDPSYGAVRRPSASGVAVDPKDRVTVGLAEPCPFEKPRDVEPQPAPSMALLLKEDYVDGQKVCRYSYEGIDYVVPAEPQQSCTLTPGY